MQKEFRTIFIPIHILLYFFIIYFKVIHISILYSCEVLPLLLATRDKHKIWPELNKLPGIQSEIDL